MTVRVYRSSDTSAPTLSGTSGDLIAVLNACLVNGYGSKTAAGWTKPSLGGTNPGTNVSVYQQGTGSNSMFLRVNDSGARVGTTDEAAGTLTGKEARVRGYEAMTGLTDAGTALIPTVGQTTSGLFVRKSLSADTVIRPWIILADARTLYMFILTGDTANTWLGWMFGEFYSFKSSDGYRVMLCARSTENSGINTIDTFDTISVVSATQSAKFVARDASASAGAIAGGFVGNISLTGSSQAGQAMFGTVPLTNETDHQIYIAPVRVSHTVGGNTFRGRMRGFWHWCHPIAQCSDGDTFSGTGSLAGKSFLILKLTGNSGVYCLETSDTWDTN